MARKILDDLDLDNIEGAALGKMRDMGGREFAHPADTLLLVKEVRKLREDVRKARNERNTALAAGQNHSLIRLGTFKLHSGAVTDWKLEADRFIRDNLEGLVRLIPRTVGPYGEVRGVPSNPDSAIPLLVKALEKHSLPYPDVPWLIVDDVLTTGDSMEEARKSARQERGSPEWAEPGNYITGVVVLARGKCPPWVKAILQLPEELWSK